MTRITKGHHALATVLFAYECDGPATMPVAASRLFGKIFVELSPLIGERGVMAVFARSVVMAKTECASLARLVMTSDSPESALAHVQRHFDTVDEQHVRDGALWLCAAFLAFMSRLIGDHLTMQLMQRAWPDVDLRLMESK